MSVVVEGGKEEEDDGGNGGKGVRNSASNYCWTVKTCDAWLPSRAWNIMWQIIRASLVKWMWSFQWLCWNDVAGLLAGDRPLSDSKNERPRNSASMNSFENGPQSQQPDIVEPTQPAVPFMYGTLTRDRENPWVSDSFPNKQIPSNITIWWRLHWMKPTVTTLMCCDTKKLVSLQDTSKVAPTLTLKQRKPEYL